LRYYGNNNCRLLNGGWNYWMAESGPVAMDIPRHAPRSFIPRPQEDLIARIEYVKRVVASGEATLLDVRASAEYEGTEARGNRRTGRIPRAVHMEWREAVQKDGTMRFRPATELSKTLESKGISKSEPVVTYCQAGVRAAHGAFTLHLMGYDDVRVYDGSFAGWGNRDDTPIEK
jgi:thiosulfate/3-mercaptopyruvate sulfurtransferase